MQSEVIQSLTETFEAHAQQTETGIEYWLARDVQHLLGYTEWRNFTTVINKSGEAGGGGPDFGGQGVREEVAASRATK